MRTICFSNWNFRVFHVNGKHLFFHNYDDTFFPAHLGDQNVQDSGASFSGWTEPNDPLGDAEEQVLSLLLAESASFDPLLDNIDWNDTYSGQMNLNPD